MVSEDHHTIISPCDWQRLVMYQKWISMTSDDTTMAIIYPPPSFSSSSWIIIHLPRWSLWWIIPWPMTHLSSSYLNECVPFPLSFCFFLFMLYHTKKLKLLQSGGIFGRHWRRLQRLSITLIKNARQCNKVLNTNISKPRYGQFFETSHSSAHRLDTPHMMWKMNTSLS